MSNLWIAVMDWARHGEYRSTDFGSIPGDCNLLRGTLQASGVTRILTRRCLIKLGDDVIE